MIVIQKGCCPSCVIVLVTTLTRLCLKLKSMCHQELPLRPLNFLPLAP